MKVFYFSCHAILEYDEIKLFRELGLDVFSAGAYSFPMGHPSLPRPSLPELTHYPELERAASTIRASGGAIPQEIIDWADVIVFMHEPEILEKNWLRMRNKKVVFRSIGQCVGHQELLLSKLVLDGLKIVRYSPMEKNIPNYAGEHSLIRFYKDPLEFKDWNGKVNEAVNISQSIRQRGSACFYDEISNGINGLGKIYGSSNEDLGSMWGGSPSYDDLKKILRDGRVYLYGGTSPASYTLSFIEAFMTGIPIVAVGRQITRDRFVHFDYYEIPYLITHEVDGFIGNTVEELRKYVGMLMNDYNLAVSMSAKARVKAVELFGKKKIKDEWVGFFNNI